MASQRTPALPSLDDGEAQTIAAPAPLHVADPGKQISGDAPTLIAGLGAGGASSAPTMLVPPAGPAATLISAESPAAVNTVGDDLEQTRGAARYEHGPLLGAGGMGEVRLHVDRRVGRRIAKKTLHASIDSEAARARFVREVRIQGQLEHPAVVPVYDLDVDAPKLAAEVGAAFARAPAPCARPRLVDALEAAVHRRGGAEPLDDRVERQLRMPERDVLADRHREEVGALRDDAELLIDGGVGTWLYKRANVKDEPDWLGTAVRRTLWPVAAALALRWSAD